MLVSFSVENFASFDEEQTLQMTAVPAYRQHEDHVIRGESERHPDVLSLAALYGANASGKSNFVKALRFAQWMITLGPRNPGERIPIEPFRLRPGRAGQPSRFDFVIVVDDHLYQYGFALDGDLVHEEWLWVTPLAPRKREVRWFEREGGQDADEIEWGAQLRDRVERREFLEFVAARTSANQLLLSELHRSNIEAVQPLFEWFEQTLTIIGASQRYIKLIARAHEDQDFLAFMTQLLRAADTGIDALCTEEREPDPELEELGRALKQDEQLLQIQPLTQEMTSLRRGPRGELRVRELRTQRDIGAGQVVTFDISQESEGTRRLMHLLPALFDMRQRPSVYVIDELDRRMHPNLCAYFLEFYLEHCREEGAPSQLILTTHDANLLASDLFRRDEVWLIEKRRHASRMFSLAEFRVRKDLDLRKGYLVGRFGAIPSLEHLEPGASKVH